MRAPIIPAPVEPGDFMPVSFRLFFPWLQVASSHKCSDKYSYEDSERGAFREGAFCRCQLSLPATLFLLYSALWTLDTLIFPNSQVHLLNSGTLRSSPWFSLPCALVWKLSPGVILGDHKTHLISFPLSEIIVLCCMLSNIWKQMFYTFSTFWIV